MFCVKICFNERNLQNASDKKHFKISALRFYVSDKHLHNELVLLRVRYNILSEIFY